jgi:signal transduction histidine kinase
MGQMAAGVAHDFNNILAAIAGYAQGLQRKLEAMPLERNFADRILGVCKKGQMMTREILGVARTALVTRDEIDLSDLIANDIDEIQGAVEGHSVVTMLPVGERLPVYGNAAQLSQLVQNLIVNATHACEGGEGRITVSAGRASAQELHALATAAHTAQERVLGVIAENRGYCFLRVADNGHGIPAAVFDHIFEPFFTTKGRSKGSGLGLVVVHGVVDSHHGCCHVVTRLGEGTAFTVYLPMCEEAETVAA